MGVDTILVVDDTDTNLEILSKLLDDCYDVMVALDGEFALEIVEDDMPDLILLDILMPNMDGYEVCRRLKENPKTEDIPVIFITAKDDEESIERAYDVGGIDYVTKPFKPKELLARIKTQLKMRQLIYDLERSKEKLKILSITDSMTKLYNRRYFDKLSKETLDLAQKEKTVTSVIMIDIDNFKKINDAYGHKVGDKVIIELSMLLLESTRSSDIVCRYGGEEFAILLPKTSADQAMNIAEMIREKVQSCTTKIDREKELKYTLSLGVSQAKADEESIEASLNRADKALYVAKESGRDRTIIE